MNDAKPESWAFVDEEGRLVVPPEIASRLGFTAGAAVRVDEEPGELRLRRSTERLAKVYVEPTSLCNLQCRTCMRNGWDEPQGRMSPETFDAVIEGLRTFAPAPSVFFGGFGEPLSHPDIVEMVRRVKTLGASAEMITNGTLLDAAMSRALVDAGLDMLWVSLDGATPGSYTDVRLGALLPAVLRNLEGFQKARRNTAGPAPRFGIEFVAMKRNIGDLPDVVRIAARRDASQVLVSNLYPYSEEMREDVLYSRALTDVAYMISDSRIELPPMDVTEKTREALYRVMRGGQAVTLSGVNLGRMSDRCPFVERGSTAVSWEGAVSPCLPLLHDHVRYLDQREQRSKRHTVGRLSDRSLKELWQDPDYAAFRNRVAGFSFSPCVFCGGCELFETNEEDCFGNRFPVCGGCLWAQGLIRCP